MNRRQKQALFIRSVALLGVVLILGVVWIMSREYRSNEYHSKAGGFSIRYPVTWSFQENTGGAAVIFFSPKANELDFFKENVNIVVQDISQAPMELKAYSKLAIKQMQIVFEDNFVIIESGPTFIAGQVAYKLIFLGKGPDTELKYMSVWTIKGLTAYQITYTALSSQY
ncbi:MAG: hypothetical protein KAR32_09495, partial [Candidatus Omnitrophica bacterium]|nr:hypothetical protein [Candidatus Omnitrophota bacterium]